MNADLEVSKSHFDNHLDMNLPGVRNDKVRPNTSYVGGSNSRTGPAS